MAFLENIFLVTAELAPWLFLGLFISSLIHLFVPNTFFRNHLGGNGFLAVIKSVFIGVPMPLCSCSVIPVALSLKKDGAGNPASVSFLISTPQTGLDSVFVSASMLGWPFAVFKLLSALFLGLVGGLISIFTDNSKSEEHLNPVEQSKGSVSLENKFKSFFDYAINDLLYMIWRWLLIGIVISAAITTWLPPELFGRFDDSNLLLLLIIVLLSSVPLYICATSSVPIAAALVSSGMPTSAALVFLVAGPATNIATIGAIYKALGFRQLLVYLSVIIIGSLGLAHLFENVVEVNSTLHIHEHATTTGYSFAFLLLAAFLYFIVNDLRPKQKKQCCGSSLDISVVVEGMSCGGCVGKITKALNEHGLQDFDVSLEKKTVSVKKSDCQKADLVEILEKVGFEAK
ncbi:MAG: permease [Lentisphaeraceae bacterium]|nr:permease [Lentisphaeraceae bacterium]